VLQPLVPFNVLKNTTFGKDLVAGILDENITALSRAITLVESTNSGHLAKANEVINACLPHANQSVRIGITGVPGG
jgi:LAO/AO transport system kinase